MKTICVFLIICLSINCACTRDKTNRTIQLYTDNTGLKVNLDVPVDWINYEEPYGYNERGLYFVL
jgi:hypothetical protein